METFGINEAGDLEQENLMESILINEDTTERDPQSKGPRLFSTTGWNVKKNIYNELGEYFFVQESEIRKNQFILK